MQRWERRAIARVIEAMVPPWTDVPPPAQMGTEPFVEALLAAQRPLFRLGLRLVFLVFAFAPPLVVGRLRPFWALDPTDRQRYFVRWAHSRLYLVRQMAFALKSAMLLLWAGHPAVAARLGCSQPGARPTVGAQARDARGPS